MTPRYPEKPDNQRTALFPGSFNPFTRGHLSIAERGAGLFDKLIIAIGVNANKAVDKDAIEQRIADIKRATAHIANVEVISYSGLTVDAAAEAGAGYILRGVRSVGDFEYERQIADVNRQLSGIETVVIFATPELSSVSSSIVRELQSYGRDVSEYLP